MKYLLSLLLLVRLAAATTFQPLGRPFKAPVKSFLGFSAHVVFSNLTTPRGITFDANQNLLVVERGFGLTAFTQVSSPQPGWTRTVVIENADFNQGIQVDGRVLYISTGSTVFVYQYDIATKSVDKSQPPLTFIDGLPPDGPVNTHTLQLEKDSTGLTTALLVGSPPADNIDLSARNPDSGRSTIRRYPIPPKNGRSSYHFSEGQTVAYGVRNPGGFAFYPGTHPKKQLYIVDNAPELDNITNFTPRFNDDNTADEFQLVQYNVDAGGGIPRPKSYGFPDCVTLWNPAADPIGDAKYVFMKRGAQISINLDRNHNDEWCRQKNHNVPPVALFQAHSAPLDLKFFSSSLLHTASSFPASFSGDAFVTFHGSFGRIIPTGFGVVHVPFVSQAVNLQTKAEFIVQTANLTGCPANCLRPVGLAFSQDGLLYASSDASGEIFVIRKGA